MRCEEKGGQGKSRGFAREKGAVTKAGKKEEGEDVGCKGNKGDNI